MNKQTEKPAKKHNVGIVGYGWVAGAHIAAINAGTQGQVTAVYSSRPLDGAALSAKHGSSISTYTDYDLMLANPDLDIVSICSYPYQHREQAVAAAKAGKHLIIEKPLALSWKDCQAIQAAVTKAAVKTCVCFECRFSSQFTVTKAILDQGLLGDIHYGEVDYYHGIGPWYGAYRWNTRKDAGGSALLTAGCHAMDALLLCMGDDVAEVSSYHTEIQKQDFRALRIRDLQRKPFEIQERTHRQMRRHRGLLAALLLPHSFGRQRRQPAGQQIQLHEIADQPKRLERPCNENARFRRRLRSSLPNPVRRVLHRHFRRRRDALDQPPRSNKNA